MNFFPSAERNEMPSFEMRVDLVDGFEIVKLEAASIEEAIQRASRIWPNPQSVTLLCRVDHQPQTFLAW